MTTYLITSISDEMYNLKTSHSLNITKKKLDELYQNSLKHMIDQFKIYIENDNIKITRSNTIRQFVLYKLNYNDHHICRLTFDVSYNNNYVDSYIHLYCGYVFNENIHNETITDDFIEKIIFTEPLFILFFPLNNLVSLHISYLNYLKSNCVFPIYFRKIFEYTIEWDKLIYSHSKIEIDDDIFNILKTIYFFYSSPNIFIFNNKFPKNNRNVIDLIDL